MITMLQGKWVSLDDKQSFIIFKGYQQIDVYGKEVLDTSAINFYKKCPEHFSAKDAKAKSGTHLAVAMPDGDILCYEIDYLTAKSLHLIYLPRGNMLRYKKL
ncbi:MAG: hypothetical protein JWQ96_2490 [Segetibacter sp.]|nr:hypothetical protein [Segetibacter sp.]